jgi:DNA mismatch repair protein MutS
LVPGGTSRSYGIQVARIAGLPHKVIGRAREILEDLERGEDNEVGAPRIAVDRSGGERKKTAQLSLFGAQDQRLRKWIQNLDLSSMTPLEALIEINKMKEYLSRQSS